MGTDTQQVILVKLREGAAQAIIDRVEASSQNGIFQYYNVSGETNEDTIRELDWENTIYHCLFVVYRDIDSKLVVQAMYWGMCSVNNQGNLHYKVTKKLDANWMCINTISYLELDLRNDFPNEGQVSIEFSGSLIDYLDYISNQQHPLANRAFVYPSLSAEDALSPLAQKNEYCVRHYGAKEFSDGRSEFQRDYDRIVHSKALRRLADKAQIFTASKGDYYRNRLTHSLIVCQIAKAIAARLGLNPYLTEAIALGHDLGHTPFGHQGERTLHSILTGNLKLPQNPLPDDECKNNVYGGFKHNYQSLRVASVLEEAYINADGLDLSVQTLEGMIKHTTTESKYTLAEFLPYDNAENDMYMQYSFSVTLEGQTVTIADEIAQRCHDLEDAFAANIMDVDGLLDSLRLKKTRILYERIKSAQHNFDKAKCQLRKVADENELLHKEISSIVVDYLVDDVVSSTVENTKSVLLSQQGHVVDKLLVSFSCDGKTVCDYLGKIISKQVINSVEVSQFDDCGERIVLGLFSAYYRNPKLLHIGTIRRVYHEMRRQNIQNIIDFETGDYNVVREEWAKINNSIEVDPLQKDEYKLKRKILVRAICDFIAGMTDTYATMEYKKICQV